MSDVLFFRCLMPVPLQRSEINTSKGTLATCVRLCFFADERHADMFAQLWHSNMGVCDRWNAMDLVFRALSMAILFCLQVIEQIELANSGSHRKRMPAALLIRCVCVCV